MDLSNIWISLRIVEQKRYIIPKIMYSTDIFINIQAIQVF